MPCFVVFVKPAALSSSSKSPLVQAIPVILRGDDPMFARIKEESRPVAAPGPLTTIPPISTSAGERDKKGALLTSLPCKVIGNEVEYFATAFVVDMVKELLFTPGLTDP